MSNLFGRKAIKGYMSRRLIAQLSLFLLVAGVAFSQQNGASAPAPAPRIQPGTLAKTPEPESKPATEQAQTEDEESPFKLFTTVTEIVVPVTVTDKDGNFVNGLQPRQFRILDNGKEQDIKVNATYYPVSVVIAVQANDAVEAVLPQVKRIGSLLETFIVGEQGEAALLAFDHRLRVLQEFTNDPTKITDELQKIRVGSTSARMNDAVQTAVRLLRNRPKERKRVVLLISETRDIASETRLREALIEAQFANVTVYTVNISRLITTLTKDPQPPRPLSQPPAAYSMPPNVVATPTTVAQKTGLVGQSANFVPLLVEIFRDVKGIFVDNTAEAFTKATGGEEFSFATQRGLEAAIQTIGDDIHSQYIITYNPNTKEEGGFHEIRVLVDHAGAKVRAKPGYWLATVR